MPLTSKTVSTGAESFKLTALCAGIGFWLFTAGLTSAQWQPPADLKSVPVRQDCARTHNGIGLSIQPSVLYPNGVIFLCPERAQAIDRERPGASYFFRVHEYGHLALHTRSEPAADTWAAEQLSRTKAGRAIIKEAALHFVDEVDRFDPRYGTGLDRALRISVAGRIPRQEWPKRVSDYSRVVADAIKQGRIVRLQLKSGYADSAEMIVTLDHQPLGFLSNRSGLVPLTIPPLVPGHHNMEFSDVWLYHAEQGGGRTEVARNLSAIAHFDGGTATTLLVQLDFDGQKLAVTASAL